MEIDVADLALVFYFVGQFELAVAAGLLLDRVVGQVHHFVLDVVQVEQDRGGPDVAFVVEVAFEHAVDRGHQHIATNVELPFVV